MAGAFLQITWGDRELIVAMNALQRFGDNALVDAEKDIGEYLLISTRERAAREVDPTGTRWIELSPKYKRYKERKRPGVPILKFDFHMLGDQLSYGTLGKDLLFGTNALYGAIHQFSGTITRGGKTWVIPARPYLGFSEEDAAEVELIVADREAQAISGASP